MSLCCETKINAPLMYEVLNKDVTKSEILPHLPVSKRGYALKSGWAEVIQRSLNK